jgi:hypothetical protein
LKKEKVNIKRYVVNLLNDGLTPQKIALAITGGIVLGIFPLLLVGVTTALCISFALLFKLNTGLIQVVNLACSPLQVMFYLPFLKAGQTIFHIPFVLSWSGLVLMFKTDFWATLKQLGILNLAGIFAWLLIALAFGTLLYFVLVEVVKHGKNRISYKASSKSL